MAVAYRSVVVETYLWQTIIDLPSVVSTFSDRITMDRVSPEQGIESPYLEITRHPATEVVRPLRSAGPVIAEGFVFDIAGYAEGFSTSLILTAMEDIDAAILSLDDTVVNGYRMVTDDLGELPPPPPPRPGEPTFVRLGKMYSVTALGGS